MNRDKYNSGVKSKRSNWGEMAPESSQGRERHQLHNLSKGKVLLEFSEVNLLSEPVMPESSICRQDKQDKNASDSSEPEEEALQGYSLTKNMLSHISSSKMALFFKSQQRGDPKLSRKEKKQIALELLESNPALFLSRFGKCLQPDHLLYFHQFTESYEVQFHLKQLEKCSASKAKLIKNRRYQAMQELIAQGEYFSMAEMKKRNHWLFQHLVERHMTAEEREEVQPAQGATCDLSTVLIAHMNRDEQHRSVRRQEQEAEKMAWNEGEPSDEGSDAESELDDDEKELLKQEFISNMHNSFLEGQDQDFDYSTVDENHRYDNLLLSERDAEERYFDSD